MLELGIDTGPLGMGDMPCDIGHQQLGSWDEAVAISSDGLFIVEGLRYVTIYKELEQGLIECLSLSLSLSLGGWINLHF